MSKPKIRTFWARVKEALTEAGLPHTQDYVADSILHMAQPSISDWNKPDGFPTLPNAVKLAKRIGVCVEWLFTERGPKRPVPADALAQRLWSLWPRLSDATKGELVGIAAARVTEETGEHPKPNFPDETHLHAK